MHRKSFDSGGSSTNRKKKKNTISLYYIYCAFLNIWSLYTGLNVDSPGSWPYLVIIEGRKSIHAKTCYNHHILLHTHTHMFVGMRNISRCRYHCCHFSQFLESRSAEWLILNAGNKKNCYFDACKSFSRMNI